MDLFKKSVILIELDAILDTRLTIYKKMGIDIDSIMQQGYNNRVYDRFPGVDYDKYMEMYKNRDNELLEAATITDLPYLIIKEAEYDYAFRDAADLINVDEIWINVYPYDLDENQKFEIGRALSEVFKGSGYGIKVMEKPRKEMTLHWMRDNKICKFYVYQYEEWVMDISDYLINLKEVFDIKVIAPWLITSELTEEVSDYLDKMIASNAHPTKLLRGHFAQWFSLELTKARLFSSILSDDIYPSYVEEPKS